MGTPAGTTSIANYLTNAAPATFQNKGVLTYGQGEQATPADVRVSTPSTNYSGASGGGNIWFTTTTGAYGFSIEGINASTLTQLQLSYGYYKNVATNHATFSIDYWNGASWVTVANTATALFNESATASTSWYSAKALALPAGAQINGLKLRFVKSGSLAIRIDDVKLTGVISTSPSISSGGALSAVNTVYGTASANPASFTVSGANLAAGITVAPPAGFEVSATNTNNFAGGGSSIIVGSGSTVANTTVFVRLAAGIDVGTYSGNIVCSSVGATDATVATVASTVSAKPVTVTADFLRKTYGNPDPELTYQSSETAPFSGALVRDAGENVGSYRIRQGDLTAGPNYAISFTENDLEIMRKNLTILAGEISKPFGQTLSLGVGQTNFLSSGLVAGEAVGTVTLTASSGTQMHDAPGVYVLMPSAATGGNFSAANYDINYAPGTLTVTAPSLSDWVAQYPGLTDSTPTGDPDGDGVPNLVEYFMGLDPASPSGEIPGYGVVMSNPATMALSYRRAKGITGVSSAVMTIGDLASTNWGTNGVQETVVDKGAYEEVTATVTNAPGETRKFMRLKVSQP